MYWVNYALLKLDVKGRSMKRILPLALIAILTACGSESDGSLGFNSVAQDITIKENQSYSYKFSLDNATSEAVISINDLPEWAIFDVENGVVSGVPSHEFAGISYSFTATAVDNGTTIESKAIVVTVNHLDLQITQQPEASLTLKENSGYSNQVAASGELSPLQYSLINAPQWLVINLTTGAISGTPGHHQAGQTYSGIKASVTDGVHEVQSDEFILVVDYIPLVFTNFPISLAADENVNFTQVISLEYNPGDVDFSATNLPAWASIDVRTGTISGAPMTDDDAVVTAGITITATDELRSITSNEIQLTVTAHNDAPIMTSSQITLSEYQAQYIVELEYSDEETPIDQLILSVSESSSDYDVRVNAEGKVVIDIINGDQLATNYIHFNASIYDGSLSSDPTIIDLMIDETDNMVASTNEGDIQSGQKITINFDQPVNVTEITYGAGAENGGCSAQIQLSVDDFATCGNLHFLYDESDSTKFVFTASNIGTNVDFKIKVLNTVSSQFGNSMSTDSVFDFYTLSGLLITEIGGKQHYDAMHWFEIYNASRSAINLSDYKVRTRATNSLDCDSSGCSVDNDHVFYLNNLIIEPGQYAVVRGHSWSSRYDDGQRVTYIGTTYYPYWDADGFIELIKESDNQTTDFVVFGYWANNGGVPAPVTASAWPADPYSYAPPYFDSGSSYTGSMVRTANLMDTNQWRDWSLRTSFNTPGGPNDVITSSDMDNDGLPDYAEVAGATYAGISLYDLGARVDQRDIFIEVDYMDSSDAAVTPREEALQKVVDAFALQGIAVHFDVGDLYDQADGINPARFDLGGGNQVPFSLGVSFDVPAGDTRSDVYEIKHDNMDYARLPIFHYMLMGYSQNADGSGGSSGLAELNGNDLLITLGNWGISDIDVTSTNILINLQSSTIMHELGHNLGLRHGGHDDVNDKPNYLSVMNYLYQLYGLPIVGSNEGDRYFAQKNLNVGSEVCGSVAMTNPYSGDYHDFKIDYSSTNVYLHESTISELSGLNQSGSAAVDFNCDGDSIDSLSNFDVNFSGTSESLQSHHDWAAIDLRFQRYYQGNFHGASLTVTEQPNDLILMEDVVGNDITPVVDEVAPSQAFFDMLNSH